MAKSETDFGKLMRGYEKTIEAYKYLEEERDKLVFGSMELNEICGDMFIDLHEFKLKYGENDRYIIAKRRLDRLQKLKSDFDHMWNQSEKNRFLNRALIDKIAGLSSSLEYHVSVNNKLHSENADLLLRLYEAMELQGK